MKKSNDMFPSRTKLQEAVLIALEELGGTADTKAINEKVVEVLDLSEDIVTMEDESGLGTKLDYRLRWVRTMLKQEGKIANVKKGTWTLV